MVNDKTVRWKLDASDIEVVATDEDGAACVHIVDKDGDIAMIYEGDIPWLIATLREVMAEGDTHHE
jgi:hypothetical protein